MQNYLKIVTLILLSVLCETLVAQDNVTDLRKRKQQRMEQQAKDEEMRRDANTAVLDSVPSAAGDTTSTTKKKKEEKPKLTSGEAVKAWHIQENSGVRIATSPDTLHLNYQITTTPVYKKYIAAEWLGNLGQPGQSAVFHERPSGLLAGDNIFQHSYKPYYLDVEDVYFYNTRVPYTNIAYYTGGFTQHGEDRLTGLFSINANKRLNFGLCFDYMYGRGSFYNQATDGISGAFNMSYLGEKYKLHFIAALNNVKSQENGGLQKDKDLDGFDDTYSLKTKLTDAQSTFHSLYVWMTNEYSVGYDKLDPDDSEKKTFVPVTTFAYTVKYQNARKRYFEKSIAQDFYQNNFYSDAASRDTTCTQFMRNIVSITFNEGFKPWALFSIRAFAEADIEENMQMISENLKYWKTETKVRVGGEIFRHTGNSTFKVLGEFMPIGSLGRVGFNLDGDFHTIVPLKTCSLTVDAYGHFKSTNPSYYQEHYYSNHFIWDKSFNNEWNARGYGKIGIPNKWFDFEVGAGWQGLKEYIYFDKEAIPQQSHDFIQIVSGEVRADLKLWWFHLENRAVFQYTSHPETLPLPLISLYSNFYASFGVWKKILKVQVGVDCRFNTAYYANAYMPATGQFYLQDETKVGNYPEMNAYVNFHLKQFRFFFMWYNFSSMFMEPKYFTTPHNPLNPSMVKIGLSWNFYD